MSYENLMVEIKEGIAVLSVYRPKALNALNKDTLLEMMHAIQVVRDSDDVNVIIVTGAGDKAFVAGTDIAYMHSLSAMEARSFALLGQEVFRMIEALEKPVIAAVHGFALGGGCELAMCCDFRIASTEAKFGQFEVGLDIIPGFSGTQRLARLVGPGMAKELLYSADIIDANEALRIGLVNHVVEFEDLMKYVKGIADQIASKGPLAVKLCKAARRLDIDRGISIEADAFRLCLTMAEYKKGWGLFLEKREANFTGK